MNALQATDWKALVDHRWLIGVDEAGRGALAGPVVAGACVLSEAFFKSSDALASSVAINDSKLLCAEERERQFAIIEQLRSSALLDFEVASGSVEEIARHNILGATRLAMRRAVEKLAERAREWELPGIELAGPLFVSKNRARLIVDGRPLKPFPYVHEGIVKGDSKSLAIAMASIAAKVTRDRTMAEIGQIHPKYGFSQHKGYGTAGHRATIIRHGASAVHRSLFLRKILGE